MPAGMYNLGILYSRGSGTEGDPARAAGWYSQAAQKGCPPAMEALAKAYDRGESVTADKGKALQWYARAGHDV